MKINESTIEQQAITTLQSLGWQYQYGKDLPFDETQQADLFARESRKEAVLKNLLLEALRRINPDMPEQVLLQARDTVLKSDIATLHSRNQLFYGYLKNGVPVRYQQNGEEKHSHVRLLDFHKAENNHFLAVNQLEIIGKKGKRIPDVVLFVNGLPLAVMELKNPLDVGADLHKAFGQLQTYQAELAELFVYNQFLVVSDGTSARFGSLTADWERFMAWRVIDEKNNSARVAFEDELTALLSGLCQPENLLDYLQHFITFEMNSKGEPIKKIAAYHQFYGVNEALDCTVAAHQENSAKIGVVWHTQGSGKSLSMLFYAGKVFSEPVLQNPTIVVVTDRNDLDGQLYATFSAGKALLRTEPVQADGREDLRRELAKRESGGVVFTTIQKFGLTEEETVHPVLNSRQNIIVISDEAHRSQYGLSQKIDNKGQYRFGYAKYLRDALPNAAFIGFTGTPIALEDKDTQEVFGRYVSVYDIQDAVEDGATVPIIYEARQIDLSQSDAFEQAVKEAQALIDEDENSENFRLREALMGTAARLEHLAADLVAHFEQRNELAEGKAMVVVMSRKICVALYDEIIKLRPEWHSDDVMKGAIKIVMTGSASDSAEMQKHIYSKPEKEALAKRFKDPDDALKIVIVRDMWLTGFDAPCCHTMYLDKPMQGHNLMQAIARVNRVFKNKSRENGGLIVDYVGLTQALKEATDQYTRSGGKSTVKTDIDDVFHKMQSEIDIIRGQFATPADGQKRDIAHALTLEGGALLDEIRLAASHILALDRISPNPDPKNPTPRKNAFLNAVRLAKKGFSLCSAMPQAAAYRQELAFYDAVRATIIKAEQGSKAANSAEKRIQLVKLLNQAVQSDGVVDLFELLKQERPNISILSEDFLKTVIQSGSRDLWVIAIEGYLKSEIKEKTSTNLAEKKRFEERLKQAMNQYQNHNLDVAEVLAELIQLAKMLQQAQERGEEMGLTPAELAFYDALAQNASAAEQMGNAELMKLAKEITHTLRHNVTIDWQQKDSVRAKMRVLVRRLLKKYKYPPDAQIEAVEFVLEQAESVAEDLSLA